MSELKTSSILNANGDLIVSYSQDISGILDNNKRLAAENNGSVKDEFRLEAVIPDIVLIEWMKMGIDFYSKEGRAKVKKMLNLPEYQHLRTSNRRL